MEQTISDRVMQMVSVKLDVEFSAVKPESTFGDLSADSLDVVEWPFYFHSSTPFFHA